MQQRSEVKPWKNRDKAQKKEETKPVVGHDTEKTIYWLVGIEWDSEGSKIVNCLRIEKNSGLGKKTSLQKLCIHTCNFPLPFFVEAASVVYQYKTLNRLAHAESLQFTQTIQWLCSSLSFSF